MKAHIICILCFNVFSFYKDLRLITFDIHGNGSKVKSNYANR